MTRTRPVFKILNTGHFSYFLVHEPMSICPLELVPLQPQLPMASFAHVYELPPVMEQPEPHAAGVGSSPPLILLIWEELRLVPEIKLILFIEFRFFTSHFPP